MKHNTRIWIFPNRNEHTHAWVSATSCAYLSAESIYIQKHSSASNLQLLQLPLSPPHHDAFCCYPVFPVPVLSRAAALRESVQIPSDPSLPPVLQFALSLMCKLYLIWIYRWGRKQGLFYQLSSLKKIWSKRIQICTIQGKKKLNWLATLNV